MNIINYKYYTNIYIIQATRSITQASQGIIEASDEMPPACHPLTACGHTVHNSATGHNVTVQLACFVKRDSAHSIAVPGTLSRYSQAYRQDLTDRFTKCIMQYCTLSTATGFTL